MSNNYYSSSFIFYLSFLRIIAEIITTPPINTLKGGISFKNNQTHIGPNKVSVNIRSPIVVEGVVLDPIVMQINQMLIEEHQEKNPLKYHG